MLCFPCLVFSGDSLQHCNPLKLHAAILLNEFHHRTFKKNKGALELNFRTCSIRGGATGWVRWAVTHPEIFKKDQFLVARYFVHL
jgi:hypothetical protein